MAAICAAWDSRKVHQLLSSLRHACEIGTGVAQDAVLDQQEAQAAILGAVQPAAQARTRMASSVDMEGGMSEQRWRRGDNGFHQRKYVGILIRA